MSSFGGYNSEEGGGLLLPFLLSSLGGGDGLLPGLAPGSALPLGSPPFLFRYRKDPPVIIRQSAPKKALSSSGHGSQIALLKCTPVPRPKVCDDVSKLIHTFRSIYDSSKSTVSTCSLTLFSYLSTKF